LCVAHTNAPLFPPAYSRPFLERPYSMSLADASRLKRDARPTHSGCGSLCLVDLCRHLMWKMHNGCGRAGRDALRSPNGWPRGYSGEPISHRWLMQSPPTDLSDLRQWRVASGDYCESAAFRSMELCICVMCAMCAVAACRQCGYLRCLSEPPYFSSSSFYFFQLPPRGDANR